MTIKFQAKHKSGYTVDGPFHPFTFPGGEAHIKTDESFNPDDYEYYIADVRGASAHDYITAAMWAQCVRAANGKVVMLVPYLPAARADRGVPDLSPYASLVLESSPDQLIYLDPHSPAWVETYSNWDDIATLTEFPFERIIRHRIQHAQDGPTPFTGVIAPDKGARDRAARAAKVMGVPVYTAGKSRDFETGKLTGFHMEDELPAGRNYLIVDDICDGGGTFVGLGQTIFDTVEDVELSLWVTHGIFSKGFGELTNIFDNIYTTNSFSHHNKDWEDTDEVTVFDVTPYLYESIDV